MFLISILTASTNSTTLPIASTISTTVTPNQSRTDHQRIFTHWLLLQALQDIPNENHDNLRPSHTSTIMHHFTSASIILGSLTVLSANARAALTLQARQAVTPNSWCRGANTMGVAAEKWAVYIPSQNESSAQNGATVGGGFLNNIRGQCGVITNWQTSMDPAGMGVYAWFDTDIGCDGGKVHDAAWLASNPNNASELLYSITYIFALRIWYTNARPKPKQLSRLGSIDESY